MQQRVVAGIDLTTAAQRTELAVYGPHATKQAKQRPTYNHLEEVEDVRLIRVHLFPGV